jgi:uncharacterized GH25 family protein
MSIVRYLLPSLILSSFMLPAEAHDFWIEPDNFMPETGDTVTVSLREGEKFKGNTLPYIEEWFADFSRTDGDGRNPVMSLTGDDPAARLEDIEGQTLLGYRSTRNFVELEAAKFNKYLEDEGIEFLREQRIARGEDDAPAPEFFVRCAKTLLQGANDGAAVYDTVLGYTLELVPLSDPYKTNVGDKLTFRLLFRGKPAENLQLQAFTKEIPDKVEKIRTDKDGIATVNLDRAGKWMIKAVQIQAIVGDPKALWQSWWASYLFELPAD